MCFVLTLIQISTDTTKAYYTKIAYSGKRNLRVLKGSSAISYDLKLVSDSYREKQNMI